MINDRSANLKEYVLRFGIFAVPGPEVIPRHGLRADPAQFRG